MTTLSTRLLRLLLRTYPHEFRERFGADLEADFEQLLRARGRAVAWRYALSDLRRGIPEPNTAAQRSRQRRYAVTLGGESTWSRGHSNLPIAARAVESPFHRGYRVPPRLAAAQ